MNRGELVEAIANDASITKAQAQEALDAFVSNVQRSLKSGDKVTLVGFGTFSALHTAGSVWEGTLKPVSPSGFRREG